MLNTRVMKLLVMFVGLLAIFVGFGAAAVIKYRNKKSIGADKQERRKREKRNDKSGSSESEEEGRNLEECSENAQRLRRVAAAEGRIRLAAEELMRNRIETALLRLENRKRQECEDAQRQRRFDTAIKRIQADDEEGNSNGSAMDAHVGSENCENAQWKRRVAAAERRIKLAAEELKKNRIATALCRVANRRSRVNAALKRVEEKEHQELEKESVYKLICAVDRAVGGDLAEDTLLGADRTDLNAPGPRWRSLKNVFHGEDDEGITQKPPNRSDVIGPLQAIQEVAGKPSEKKGKEKRGLD